MRFTILVLLSLVALPGVALAESAAPSCVPGTFAPSSTDIPVNLSAFVLSGGIYPLGAAPTVQLFERVGPTLEERAVDVARDTSGPIERWIVTPTEALVEGSTYELTDSSCGGPPSLTFQVGAAVPAPATLGVTTVSELRVSRTSATSPLRYYVRVALALSDEARAARVLYESQRLVDGVSPEGGWLPLDDSDVRLAVDCGGGLGGTLEPGTRSINHHAQPYGLDPTLSTDPVDALIACEDAVRVHPDDEHPLTPEEIEAMDRSPFDGAAPGLDAGVQDAGTSGMGGGGCSVRPMAGGPAASWFALALVGLVFRRRAASRRATARRGPAGRSRRGGRAEAPR